MRVQKAIYSTNTQTHKTHRKSSVGWTTSCGAEARLWTQINEHIHKHPPTCSIQDRRYIACYPVKCVGVKESTDLDNDPACYKSRVFQAVDFRRYWCVFMAQKYIYILAGLDSMGAPRQINP